MTLIEKQQKYQHYYQAKLINEYLTGKEILSSDQSIEQTKFIYSPLGKTFKKNPYQSKTNLKTCCKTKI